MIHIGKGEIFPLEKYFQFTHIFYCDISFIKCYRCHSISYNDPTSTKKRLYHPYIASVFEIASCDFPVGSTVIAAFGEQRNRPNFWDREKVPLAVSFGRWKNRKTRSETPCRRANLYICSRVYPSGHYGPEKLETEPDQKNDQAGIFVALPAASGGRKSGRGGRH